ncbi:hypothetical protein JTB14_012352 [Gonioctena quinquepunctata]|nr:hypothetical protein JTB14_012352 [Gonioctena quinquepunctata]
MHWIKEKSSKYQSIESNESSAIGKQSKKPYGSPKIRDCKYACPIPEWMNAAVQYLRQLLCFSCSVFTVETYITYIAHQKKLNDVLSRIVTVKTREYLLPETVADPWEGLS